ncbi:MAG: ferredoxin [Firmicutes bacterium]|nr:ferredoxin [Bacillota bacterium]
MKKVDVNQDLCIGCGACQAIVDKVFEIDDNGLATVKCNLIEQELEEDVVDAAEGCPTGAIIVENNE